MTARELMDPGLRAGYRAALSELSSAQKSSKGAPAYSRFVNRPLGRRFAAAAAQVGLTPNSVTAVSATFSFAAIFTVALIEPSVLSGTLVALGLVVGYALDAADGQLARLRGGGTLAGEWLDHMVDAVKISSLHLAVLIAMFRWFELPTTWLLVPLAFALVGAVSFFGMTLNDQLRRQVATRTGEPVAITTTSPLRSVLVLPTDYGLLCLIFVLLGWPPVFFAAYAILFAGSAVYLLLASVKWFRVMQGLDARLRNVTGLALPDVPLAGSHPYEAPFFSSPAPESKVSH